MTHRKQHSCKLPKFWSRVLGAECGLAGLCNVGYLVLVPGYKPLSPVLSWFLDLPVVSVN